MDGIGGVVRDKTFEGWYRREHPRLLGLLTVVAGDVDAADEAIRPPTGGRSS